MIITKGIVEGEVVTIKLVTGEEIIGKLEKIEDTSYTFSNLSTLVMTKGDLGLQPWILTGNPAKNLNISKEKIICMVETEPKMATQIRAAFSGITTRL